MGFNILHFYTKVSRVSQRICLAVKMGGGITSKTKWAPK